MASSLSLPLIALENLDFRTLSRHGVPLEEVCRGVELLLQLSPSGVGEGLGEELPKE